MFTVDEILAATGGRIIRGARSARSAQRSRMRVCLDSRAIARGQVFVAVKGQRFDGHDFIVDAVKKGASCAVFREGRFSPGRLGRDCVLVGVKDTLRALADLARFHRRRFDIPLIAVTGSNGKTTTKDMCAWVLGGEMRVNATRATENNQIGVPLTLLRLEPGHGACVVELGSNHFGEIRTHASTCAANVGVITNIGPSHLEHFGGLGGVLREKWSLIDNLSSPAIAVINRDDPFLARTAIAKKHKPIIISIGIRGPADFRARRVSCEKGRVSFSLHGRRFVLNTAGSYNVYNALSACAAARIMGLGYGAIAGRLADFEFPAGRLKFTRVMGTTFIDDSYNSSPASLGRALEVLKNFPAAGRRVLVMGDMLELGRQAEMFHRRAGRQAARSCSLLVTVGRLSRLSREAFLKAPGTGKQAYSCANAAQAKELLARKLSLTKRDVVLVKGSRRMNLDLIFKDN